MKGLLVELMCLDETEYPVSDIRPAIVVLQQQFNIQKKLLKFNIQKKLLK